MTSLSVGGVEVAALVTGAELPAQLSPRPYLHPVRTLAGEVLTTALPEDHPHHLGLGVAIPLVGGSNLWGGPTYLPGTGYQWIDDHGRQDVTQITSTPGELSLDVLWRGRGEQLLTERRVTVASAVPGAPHAWRLFLTSTLHNVAGHPLELSGPAARGRAGAAYGGVFWRGPVELRRVEVRTPSAAGEAAVDGSGAAPLVLCGRSASTGPCWSVVLRGLSRCADRPWFVRLHEYVGVGPSLVHDAALTVEPAAELSLGIEAVIVDGEVSAEEGKELLGVGSAREIMLGKCLPKLPERY